MAKWYYLINGQEQGPVEPAALKQLATAGHLKPTDKVRREDMAEWYEAKQVKGLFSVGPSQRSASSKIATATTRPNGVPATTDGNGQPTTTSLHSPSQSAKHKSSSANSSDKSKRLKRILIIGGCVFLVMALLGGLIPIIDPGFHERLAKERRDRAPRSSEVATNSKKTTRTTIDTSKLSALARAYFANSETFSFDPNSFEDTMAWGIARNISVKTSSESGNALVAKEIEAAIKDEIGRFVGTNVVWDLDVDKVTESHIVLDTFGWLHFPTGTRKVVDTVRIYARHVGGYGPLEIPIGTNQEFAKGLIRGSVAPVKARLLSLAVFSDRLEILLGDAAISDR